MPSPSPIFLLSLPRSGSTLLQRILARHPAVATAGEPWLLLAPLYALRSEGVRAEYAHREMAAALSDLITALPDGIGDYHRGVAALAGTVYGALAGGGETWFLDKTPRYHLVCEELAAIFPDARFLVLWRDPLAVVASMVESWHGGKWYLEDHRIDLYEGIDRLTRLAGREDLDLRALRYEELLADPEGTAADLCEWLGIEAGHDLVAGATGPPPGERMGDRVGSAAYDGVDSEPLEKWRHALASPVRKAWCRRWLEWIGRERLFLMGYDLDELTARMEGLPNRPGLLLPDLVRGWRMGRLAAREGYPLD